MNKYLFSFILLFSGLFALQAQDLEIYHDGELVGDTILLSQFDPVFGEIMFEANIKNNTNRDVNVKLARKNISIVEGTSNSYCWADNCWPSELDTCPNAQTIAGGEMSEDGDFSGHYLPKTHEGTSIIKYTFWDETNPETKAEVVVKYIYNSDGIEDNIYNSIKFSNAYPNPARDYVNFEYSANSNNNLHITITNLMGNVVKTIPLKNNKGIEHINISNLPTGIYFYSIVTDNKIIKTKKLLIE